MAKITAELITEIAFTPSVQREQERNHSRAQVERGIVLRIEALDWNCPQHITPRFTEEEVADLVIPLVDRIREHTAS